MRIPLADLMNLSEQLKFYMIYRVFNDTRDREKKRKKYEQE